ncbi:Phosphoglycerate mutase [Pirellula staleyi DSM 6068]|uniref:Phosphoglycerate mutase n=1 Tax=Pirellula staleyi (strain ATCC 27377 / DSM 6068 / ICPB 4128) TaxID=530564 RepID=D2R710_PIRSD|nr:histidine phosphatase family protein [Pirellula staleyi]ADB19213.1 Phosphoglycerate mutase [Pirellula staleyi DSM 6068]
MSASEFLKREIEQAMEQVAGDLEEVVSATITGSFDSARSLDAIADIDVVVVVEPLTTTTFQKCREHFSRALADVVEQHGLSLVVNDTLGPRKLDAPGTAVLHLMMYSPDSHRDHVLASPLTCFDWQRSRRWFKNSLAEIFPCPLLQPRHLAQARRGAGDYLADLAAGELSFRRIEFVDQRLLEVPCRQPMTMRDRLEFGYHVMKFLMLNFLKLIARQNLALTAQEISERYFREMPAHRELLEPLFLELTRRKTIRDFAALPEQCQSLLELFLQTFQQQFAEEFQQKARSFWWFRHAATPLSRGPRRFVGSTDLSIDEQQPSPPVAWKQVPWSDVTWISSPLRRATESIELLRRTYPESPAFISTDERLRELNYGACEGLTVDATRQQFPELFDAWTRGEDPAFPGGDCTADLETRLDAFVTELTESSISHGVIATHQGVLRVLLARHLGIARADAFRLEIPHLYPIEMMVTPRYGSFVNLSQELEPRLFARDRWGLSRAYRPPVGASR